MFPRLLHLYNVVHAHVGVGMGVDGIAFTSLEADFIVLAGPLR